MRGRKVGDVMTAAVVVVEEETPFKEVVRTMHEHRVSGVPVVDGEKRIVGIVTEADLLAVEEEQVKPEQKRSFLEWFLAPARVVEHGRRVQDLLARDVMTGAVVTTALGMPVPEAAKLMLDAAVKRLPVVDEDGRVIGIVSRQDLLTPFLRTDDEIQREIKDDVVLKTMWIDPATIEVRVKKGVVTLRGRVERKGAKEILIELVRRVDGVVGVEDELTYEWDDREASLMPELDRNAPAWGEDWVSRSR